jgi:hypothetical protein
METVNYSHNKFHDTSRGAHKYNHINMFIFSTPLLIRHLWQLKTVVFLHMCLLSVVVLRPVLPSSDNNWQINVLENISFLSEVIYNVVSNLPSETTMCP